MTTKDMRQVLERLDALTAALSGLGELSELKLYTPAEAAELLRKTENWVVEAINFGRIPYTRVGKSPRLKAAHIRWIAEQGEVLPVSAAA